MTEKDFKRSIITISKDALANLPAAEYNGKICVIDKPEDVDSAVRDLRTADIIGFDSETRPSFKRGQCYNVSLIQLATPDCCYLFRTNKIGFPKELIDLFEDSGLTKVGLSIHDDFHNIRKIANVEPQSFIDLQAYVKKYKIADNSLSRLYGILFGKRISKSQRLTNWENKTLSESQQHYAALDAAACVEIYKYLEQGLFNPSDSPYLTLPPEPVIENPEGNNSENA